MSGVNINLLPATGYVLINGGSATNDEKAIGVLPASVCGRFVEASFYVYFDHTSAAGTVLIESAPYRDYDGVWVTEGTVNWAAIDKAHRVTVNLLSGAMRARITSTVTSGTVTVRVFAATNS